MLSQYNNVELLITVAICVAFSYIIPKVWSFDNTFVGKLGVLMVLIAQVPTIVCLYEVINRNL